MSTDASADADGFRHEALFYAGAADFVAGTSEFIRDGLAGGEPVLVVVSAEKIALLRGALGADADDVLFADMAEVGSNPARIIPAWRDFVEARAGSGAPLRGIGEPAGVERTVEAVVECHHNEALLNLAFADTPGFWLLCPYDTLALPPEMLEEAQLTHPWLAEGPVHWENSRYAGLGAASERSHEPLVDPPGQPVLEFTVAGEFALVRQAIADRAIAAGLTETRTNDLLLAAHEIATNCVRHGGGSGRLRLWHDDGELICELADRGHFDEPLAGRARPIAGSVDGYGLWIANQVCDLVQLRSLPSGTVVRLHMRTP